MDRHEPLRIIHVAPPPSRLATIRDVAIILVCAALLLGTIADALLSARRPDPPPARPVSSLAM